MPSSRSSATSNLGRATLTVDEATTRGGIEIASIPNSPGGQTGSYDQHTEPFPPLSPSPPDAVYTQEMTPSATEADELKSVEQKPSSSPDVGES